MARKQEQARKQEARAVRGSLAVRSIGKGKDEETPRPVGEAALLNLPVQPVAAVSDAERMAMKATSAPTVEAVEAVAKLVEDEWTIEAGNKVYAVWAGGFKQADEAMILFVRDFQTGKLPFITLNGVFMSNRKADTSRDFASTFRSYAKDLGMNLKDHYKGDAVTLAEGDWAKSKGDSRKYLTVRINEQGTALECIVGTRSDAGGSEAQPFDEAKAFNKLQELTREYCDGIGAKYRQLPATMTAKFSEVRGTLTNVIDVKAAGYAEQVTRTATQEQQH